MEAIFYDVTMNNLNLIKNEFNTWSAQRTRHISLIVFFLIWRNFKLKSLLFILYFSHFFKDVNFRKWFLFLLAEL